MRQPAPRRSCGQPTAAESSPPNREIVGYALVLLVVWMGLAMAPLPDNQKNIRIPFRGEDVATIVLEQKRIQKVMASLGGGL